MKQMLQIIETFENKLGFTLRREVDEKKQVIKFDCCAIRKLPNGEFKFFLREGKKLVEPPKDSTPEGPLGVLSAAVGYQTHRIHTAIMETFSSYLEHLAEGATKPNVRDN